MAKNRIKKQSNRTPARQRYKVEKKVRDHNRKLRRKQKKLGKKPEKSKLLTIPNQCPFKEHIIEEMELQKSLQNEEIVKKRADLKLAKKQEKCTDLQELVDAARAQTVEHEMCKKIDEKHAKISSENRKNPEQSLKQYYKEFRKVCELSDVILEILDARDPLGTKSREVEALIQKLPGLKRHVLILNKSDLIPKENLQMWLKYLKKHGPVLPFKASVQNQTKNLGQRRFNIEKNGLKGSNSVGADLLMQLLKNYCRNEKIKVAITVGVVGLPNVGKSSIINSLKRTKTCKTGAMPGITKSSQIVHLDSKIQLLDSPGVVFSHESDENCVLKNAVKISQISDPFVAANTILKRISTQFFMHHYDITEFRTPDEFYALCAQRQGKFRKGGVPDQISAARALLDDWNNGKIPYFTLPPTEESIDAAIFTIVDKMAEDFRIPEGEEVVDQMDTTDELEK